MNELLCKANAKFATVVTMLCLGLMVGGQAAAVGPDFSSILTGLDASTAITAVLAAAVIIAGVGFAIWGGKKVAAFFGR